MKKTKRHFDGFNFVDGRPFELGEYERETYTLVTKDNVKDLIRIGKYYYPKPFHEKIEELFELEIGRYVSFDDLSDGNVMEFYDNVPINKREMSALDIISIINYRKTRSYSFTKKLYEECNWPIDFKLELI